MARPVRRLLAALAALSCWAAGVPAAEPPRDQFPKAARAYVVAIDGQVRWARAAEARLPPASLTKIMTALLLLEDGWRPDAEIRVSVGAAGAPGKRLGLRAGERIGAADALAAMLLNSANDACLALAEHAAGSLENFVARMNRRAAALGLKATRYANPCGHDAGGHFSSAADLLRLAQRAMQLPEFARLVALDRARISTRSGRDFEVANSNALIGRFPGAAGVKTGYTSKAGKCVVAYAERDGVRVMAVLLDAPDRWWTAAGLLEAAFDEAHGRN